MGRSGGLVMASMNGPCGKWVLDHLEVRDSDRVLEVCIGPGLLVLEATKRSPRGLVAGVDPSEIMLAQASRRNASAIGSDRAVLRRAEAADLPFPDRSFDRRSPSTRCRSGRTPSLVSPRCGAFSSPAAASPSASRRIPQSREGAVIEGGPRVPLSDRVWVDTDAVCGLGRRTDPDDCLALLLLARSRQVEIVGISTGFGNAALEETDRVTRALAARVKEAGLGHIPVYRGAASPAGPPQPAHEARNIRSGWR